MESFYLKYKDLIIFLVGFVMTSIVGSYVTFEFQNRSWKNQHEVEIIDYEREQSVKVFVEISSIMDNRLYRMRKVFWSKKFKVDQIIYNSRKQDYEEILDLWNSNINKNLALLERYFGKKNRIFFETQIHYKFVSLTDDIAELIPEESTDSDFRHIEYEIDKLNSLIYKFDQKILHSIK